MMAPLAAAIIGVAGSVAGGSNGVVGGYDEYPMGDTSGSSPGAPGGVGHGGGGSDGPGGGGSRAGGGTRGGGGRAGLREAAPRVGGGRWWDEAAPLLAAADPLDCAAGCSNASLAA